MTSTAIESWGDLGARISEARKTVGVSQADLARELGIDRTAVSKVEAGQRGVDSLELAKIARALRRPVEWFLELSPPAVISRRTARDVPIDSTADVMLEQWSRDVQLLIDLGTLAPAERPTLGFSVDSVTAAERGAKAVRDSLSLSEAPLRDLARVADRLGVFVISVALPDDSLDGSYVALDRGGVAVLNGSKPTGRRRFTLAHEIGHHILADAYSAEWIVESSNDARERLIDAFAVHLLMPRTGIGKRWHALNGARDPRGGALALAAEFGVSWSAACAQLRNLDLIDEGTRQELVSVRPTTPEYLERELAIFEDLHPPHVSPAAGAAVIKAFRGSKITRARAIELLRETIGASELPTLGAVPLEAMRNELRPLD